MTGDQSASWTLSDNLTLDALAARHEWVALAAVCEHLPPQIPNVAVAVAPMCADADAFAFLWHVMRRRAVDTGHAEPTWPTFDRLPDSVTVPRGLSEEVHAFVVAPAAGATAAEHVARGKLLGALPRDLSRAIAKQVLGAAPEERPAEQVVQAALERLSDSKQSAIRNLVLVELDRRAPAERLRLLVAMHPKPDLIAPLFDTVFTLASAVPNELLPVFRQAFGKLATPLQRKVLYQALAPTPGARVRVFDEEFIEDMGYAKVVELVRLGPVAEGADLNEASAAAFVNDILSVASPEACVYVLDRVASEISPPVLLAARTTAARRCDRLEAENPARLPLQRSLVVSGMLSETNLQSDPSLTCLRAGDMSAVVTSLPRAPITERAAQLGALLAWYPAQGDSRPDLDAATNQAERAGDAAAALAQVPADYRAAVLRGHLGVAVPIPAPMLEYVSTEATLTAVVASDRPSDALTWAGQCAGSPEVALLVLRVAEAADDAGETVVTTCVGLLEAWLNHLDLADGPASSAEALVSVTRRWPALLFGLARRQLETWRGAEATYAPAARVQVLLRAALDEGLASTDPGVARDHIELMVNGAPELAPLAARWLTEAAPTAELVALCAEADGRYAGPGNPYPAARKSQAKSLVNAATDAHTATDERVAALTLANRADERTAREAALTLAGSTSVEVRRTAAHLLAETRGSLDESADLEELMEAEKDRDAKDLLRLALLRIQSGNVGEAMRNLLDLVGSDKSPESAPVATVLRFERWHKAFISCVDEARSARLGTARGAIDALQRLGELLTEQALMVVLLNGNASSKAEGLRLRDNIDKPDIGSVAGRQQLQQEHQWLPNYLVLHGMRGVHPAKRGTTRPQEAGASDVTTALTLLGYVVDGWLSTTAAFPPDAEDA